MPEIAYFTEALHDPLNQMLIYAAVGLIIMSTDWHWIKMHFFANWLGRLNGEAIEY